ncbi:MAG: AAA family ATPase, partial [Verrucomicrobia bacterium]|nr:AAA family ATPase [Verrucomicrobiota bacterium]
KAEGCVTHKRLVELSKKHPSELTKALHSLVDRKILQNEGAGKGTFYYLTGEHPIKKDIAQGLNLTVPFHKNSEHLIKNSEHLGRESSEHLIKNSEHLALLQKIAKNVTESKKSTKDLVKQVICDLCKIQPLSISEMAWLLNRKEDSLRVHYINPMCDQGELKRQYPNILKHPKQKYYTHRT